MKSFVLRLILGSCMFSTGWTQTASKSLNPGDILYVDSGDAIAGAYVVKLDPHTREQTIIASHLNLPEGIAMDQRGEIILASDSSVIGVDPETGRQALIADVGKFGETWGLAISGEGEIFATYIGGRLVGTHREYFPEYGGHAPKFKPCAGVLCIDPQTGSIKSLSTGHLFQYPISLAIAESGDLFVTSLGFPGAIIRMSSNGGSEKVVSRGDHLHFPLGIVVQGHYAYVTAMATEDQNFGIGAIVKVDIETGAQSVLTFGENLLKPVGIALDLDGQLIVTDPYTINPASSDLYDGGIIRIDPVSGAQTLLARGHGNLVNPLAVTVVKPFPNG